MILKGFCEVQNKEYEIDIEVIRSTALEDTGKGEISYGMSTCKYATESKTCSGSKCSILKENGIIR